jgi:hypothetical protein
LATYCFSFLFIYFDFSLFSLPDKSTRSIMNPRPDSNLRRARSATGREQPTIHGENEQSAAEERFQRLERMIEMQTETQTQMSAQLQTLTAMMQQVLTPAQAQFPTPEVAATRIKTEVSTPVPTAAGNQTLTAIPAAMHVYAQTPAQTTATVPAQNPIGVPRIASADYFSGERDKLESFLDKCFYQFEAHPAYFSNERAKVMFAAGCFTGKASSWFSGLLREKSALLDNFRTFAETLETKFGDKIPRVLARERLLDLCQTSSVQEFADELTSLNRHAKCDGEMLGMLFRCNLKDEIRHELTRSRFDGTLEELVEEATWIEAYLHQKPQSASQPPAPSSPFRPTNTPKQPHRDPRECSFCGKEGHLVGNCFTRLNQLKPSQPSGTPAARSNSARRPRPRVNAALLSAQTVPSDQGKGHAQ